MPTRPARGTVAIESVGGVDAAARVQVGEPFDVVVLARDAIDELLSAGHLVAGSAVDLARSGVAIAVRAGAPRPEIDSEDALRCTVLGARTIGASTGPSGVELKRLFARWGIADEIRGRDRHAAAGRPRRQAGRARRGRSSAFSSGRSSFTSTASTCSADADADPDRHNVLGCRLCAHEQPDAAHALLAFMASPAAVDAKRRQGMDPP